MFRRCLIIFHRRMATLIMILRCVNPSILLIPLEPLKALKSILCIIEYFHQQLLHATLFQLVEVHQYDPIQIITGETWSCSNISSIRSR